MDYIEAVTYMQLPVLVDMALLDGSGGNLFLDAGNAPVVAVCTGGEYEDYAGGSRGGLTDSYYTNCLNCFNVSLLTVLAYEFGISPTSLLGLELVVVYHSGKLIEGRKAETGKIGKFRLKNLQKSPSRIRTAHFLRL